MNLQAVWSDLMTRGRGIVAYHAAGNDAVRANASARAWVGEAQGFLSVHGEQLDADYPGQNLVDSLGAMYNEVGRVVNETDSSAMKSPLLEGAKAGARDAAGRIRNPLSSEWMLALAVVAGVFLLAKLR